MAPRIPLLHKHWGEKSKISVYPKRQPLCSSEYLEDHPSPPEATTEPFQRRAPTVTSTMSSSPGFIAVWADPSSLPAVIRTEWTEGLEENFYKDKWFGRQLLLYYQVEKMAPQFHSLKGIELSVSIASLRQLYNSKELTYLARKNKEKHWTGVITQASVSVLDSSSHLYQKL